MCIFLLLPFFLFPSSSFLFLFLFFSLLSFDVKKIISARMICQNPIHLKRVVQNVAEGGGEGVILQRLASNYEQGRSASLIKLKVRRGKRWEGEERERERRTERIYQATQEDMEGIVTGIGKCKSVLLKLYVTLQIASHFHLLSSRPSSFTRSLLSLTSL